METKINPAPATKTTQIVDIKSKDNINDFFHRRKRDGKAVARILTKLCIKVS